MNKKAAFIILGIILGCFAYAPVAVAHRSGCHRWHSCPSDSGSYTCGDWGYDNYCGNTYGLSSPVITTKDEISDLPIPYEIIIQENPNEYVGHEEVINPGKSGVKRSKVSVRYENGVESYRSFATYSMLSEPVKEVRSVGVRKKPTAFIDYVMQGDEKRFLWFKTKQYDVYASGEAEKDFALIKNGKVVDLGVADKTGSITFKNIELRKGDFLEIGTYKGNKILWIMPTAKSLSEKTYVNLSKLSVLTEYDKIHGKMSTEPRDTDIETTVCTDEVKNSYLKSRTKADEITDKSIGGVNIHYPIPCHINLE